MPRPSPSAAPTTTPPQSHQLTFPSNVNVPTAARTITFSASATDNATGVEDVKLTFDKGFFGGTGPGSSTSTARPRIPGPTARVALADASSRPCREPILTGVVVTDGAGNTHSYTVAQFQTLGFPTTLTVTGDSSKPTLAA